MSETKDFDHVEAAKVTGTDAPDGRVTLVILCNGYSMPDDTMVWIGTVPKGGSIAKLIMDVQLGSPDPLRLSACVEASPLEVFMLRRALQKSVYRDRWYSLTDEVVSFLDAVENGW